MNAAATIAGVARSTPHRTLCWLQVADVALTALVLAVGGSEQNPVARFLTDLGWAGLVSLVFVKLTIVALLYRKGATVRLISAVYVAVVTNNLLFVFVYFWRYE